MRLWRAQINRFAPKKRFLLQSDAKSPFASFLLITIIMLQAIKMHHERIKFRVWLVIWTKGPAPFTSRPWLPPTPKPIITYFPTLNSTEIFWTMNPKNNKSFLWVGNESQLLFNTPIYLEFVWKWKWVSRLGGIFLLWNLAKTLS